MSSTPPMNLKPPSDDASIVMPTLAAHAFAKTGFHAFGS